MPTPLTVGTGRALLSANGRPLLRDTFTDANATALASHTPEVGGAWTEHVGTWTIQSNALTQTNASNSTAFASIDAGRADYRLTAVLNHGASGGEGITFRYVDTSNYWLVMCNGAANWILYEVIAGAFNQRATFASPAPAFSTTYTITIQCRGANIDVAANGVTLFSYATPGTGLTATRVGGRWNGAVPSTLDSLLVQGL